MWFRFSGDNSDVGDTFVRAIRRMTLGDEVTWHLFRDQKAATSSTWQFSEDSLGRVLLGRVQCSHDNQVWEDITRSDLVARLPDVEELSSTRSNEVIGIATYAMSSHLQQQFRVVSVDATPGQVLIDLGLPNTNRIQDFLDHEIGRLPTGKVPLIVQEGQSDLDLLAWMPVLLTNEASVFEPEAPRAVALTGSDGNGWHLVPLHSLSERPEVPELLLPEECSDFKYQGRVFFPVAERLRSRVPHCAFRMFTATGLFDPAAFS